MSGCICGAPEDAISSREKEITACNPSLPAFPSAHHGNMKAACLQILLSPLWGLCLVTLSAGEPQLRLPARPPQGTAKGMGMGPGKGEGGSGSGYRHLCGMQAISGQDQAGFGRRCGGSPGPQCWQQGHSSSPVRAFVTPEGRSGGCRTDFMITSVREKAQCTSSPPFFTSLGT